MSKIAFLKDYRSWCLVLALSAALAMFLYPKYQEQRPVYNFTLVIDITRSMNAEDYQINNRAVSRLEFVKHALHDLLMILPCQSKLGLGVFTERRSTLLFEPIEVCSSFGELNKSIAALDWRMAWAADSRIANGLSNTLQEMAGKNTNVLFVTDGQEAPPVNPRYAVNFSAVKHSVKGMIVGVGGLQPVAIPKYDNNGRRNGVYGSDDVAQRSYFGESNLNPEQIDGYDPRNAPFGKSAPAGTEHLTALQENYLKYLANETGLKYHRLTGETEEFFEAVQSPEFAHSATTGVNLALYYALIVLVLLLAQLV